MHWRVVYNHSGYSNYSEYRGSMHILYEQSRMVEDGVRRPEGLFRLINIVYHQFVSTIANLESLDRHSKAMYQDFGMAENTIFPMI